MKLFLVISSSLILLGCGLGNEKRNITPVNGKDSVSRNLDSKPIDAIISNFDTIEVKEIKDYLNLFDPKKVFYGGIQSDELNGFVYPLISANDSNQFEMIWVPKMKQYNSTNYDTLKRQFVKEKSEAFFNFNIVVVEVPKMPVADLEDEFSMGLITPCIAKSFVRVDGKWYSYTDQKIKTFKDLSSLKTLLVEKIDGL